MRRAAKRDTAEPAIIQALQALGWDVYQVSGPGLFDLAAVKAGVWRVCEVKSTEKRTRKGASGYRKDRLTPTQQKAGIARKWPIVRDLDEAIAAFEGRRR